MMWPYFLMVGVPALLALLGESFFNRKTRNRLVVVSFFVIWLTLLCFRSERLGVDTINYHSMFIDASRMSYGKIFSSAFSNNIDIGFYLLAKTISIFTMNFRVMMVVCALIALVPMLVLYYFEADQYAYLSIVIFLGLGLFSIYFSALRQVMSVAFVVPAYYFTKNRRFVFFLLMVALAYFIHHSAVIMLLLYPVYHLHFRLNTNLLLLIPVIILIYIFRVPVFSFLAVFISDSGKVSIKETGAMLVFVLLMVFFLFCYALPDPELLDKDTIGLRNLLFLAAVLQIFAGINSVAMRMNYYYLVFVPLLIPRIINYTSEKNRGTARVAFVVMVGFFTVWYFFRAYTTADILHVYPYIPAWAI